MEYVKLKDNCKKNAVCVVMVVMLTRREELRDSEDCHDEIRKRRVSWAGVTVNSQ